MNLPEIIASLGGTAGLIALGNEVYRLYRRREAYNAENVTKNEWEIYKELNFLMQRTGASKVLILKTHNGGDMVQVGKRIYSSVTHEVNGSGMPVSAGNWMNQPLDEGYTKFLVAMLENKRKKIVLFTDDVPEDFQEKDISIKVEGNLRDVYKAEKIHHTIVSHIYTYVPNLKPHFFIFHGKEDKKQGQMWYLSLVFEQEDPPNSLSFASIRACRNNIRNIFLEQYKYD